MSIVERLTRRAHESKAGDGEGEDERALGPPAPPSGTTEHGVPEELTAPSEEPPPAPERRVVVPRWVQLVGLPLLILAGWELLKAAKHVVLLFIVAAIIALILNPLVALVQRTRMRRGLAVLSVYLAFFLTLAGIGVLLANPVSNQVSSFTHNLPGIVNSANKTIADAQKSLDKNGIHVHLVKQGKTALQTLQGKVAKASSSIASFGGTLLTNAVSAGFDLILIFVLSVYMLLYGQRIGRLVRGVMPPGAGTPDDDYPLRVQRAVSSYVRGQLVFSLIMGTTAGMALYLYGVLGIFPDGRTYAVAFGAWLGFMELIPYLGPVLGALPPVLVALFADPLTAVWVVLLFLALQQLEGHIVAPQIFGHSLRVNPILVIFALLAGDSIYGIVGALIALPVVAVLRETLLYLSRHLVFEPWSAERPSP